MSATMFSQGGQEVNMLYRISLFVLLTLFACSKKVARRRTAILSFGDGAYGEPCERRCARID